MSRPKAPTIYQSRSTILRHQSIWFMSMTWLMSSFVCFLQCHVRFGSKVKSRHVELPVKMTNPAQAGSATGQKPDDESAEMANVVIGIAFSHGNLERGIARDIEGLAFAPSCPVAFTLETNPAGTADTFHDFRRTSIESQTGRQDHTEGAPGNADWPYVRTSAWSGLGILRRPAHGYPGCWLTPWIAS